MYITVGNSHFVIFYFQELLVDSKIDYFTGVEVVFQEST